LGTTDRGCFELLKAILRVFMNEIMEFELIQMKFIDRKEISRKFFWCYFVWFERASEDVLV
jgi:hypothetical protein